MERTTPTKGNLQANALINKLEVLSTLSNRMGLAAKMSGQTFGGDRDINSALGYPENLVFADYYTRYCRQDMAKAIIDRPVDRTWKGDVELVESNDDQETALEKAWKQLCDDYKIKSVLRRADKLTGLGRYGVLMLGLSDVTTIEGYAQPIADKTQLKLLYLKPLSEDSAKIAQYETEPSNKRFGLPTIYQIQFHEAGSTSLQTINVHYTRVIHIVDDILESEIEGTPRLTAVFNRLIDLDKIVGGDGEMFWRGARPGYAGSVDKDFNLTPDAIKKIQDQIDEYEHNLRRFIVNQGMNVQALAQQLADPTNHVNIQIQMISAATGIPQRLLTGSERGELASGQDADEWRTYIQSRREEYVEPWIIRPFVNRLMELGILPPAKEKKYSVLWEDLFAMNEEKRVDIGAKRSTALKDYMASPMAEAIVPPAAFMEFFLGFTAEQIELIKEILAAVPEEERPLSPEEQKSLDEEDEITNE